jgi:hypothetical protein
MNDGNKDNILTNWQIELFTEINSQIRSLVREVVHANLASLKDQMLNTATLLK